MLALFVVDDDEQMSRLVFHNNDTCITGNILKEITVCWMKQKCKHYRKLSGIFRISSCGCWNQSSWTESNFFAWSIASISLYSLAGVRKSKILGSTFVRYTSDKEGRRRLVTPFLFLFLLFFSFKNL